MVSHTHSSECYTKQRCELICTLPETVPHIHTDACYDPVRKEEMPHVHTDTCYTRQRGELTCVQQECEGHVHDDGCYIPGDLQICGKEDETHTHDDSCIEQILVCQTPESAGYAHTDDCYEWKTVLSCGLEESCGGAQPERNLICTQKEQSGHLHSDACYRWTEVLSCGKEESAEVSDGEQSEEETAEPSEEPVDDVSQSDPTADVDWREDWEKSVSQVELTGAWPDDLVAVAQSQLGYQESERNFLMVGTAKKGYTRYGHWYGDHYGDWCAMFASFCLHYAQIDAVPFHHNSAKWIGMLQESGMYREADIHTPRPGDLVFFDYGRKNTESAYHPNKADHMGIVVKVTPGTRGKAAGIVTIEGNNNNRVCHETYDLDNPAIIGYGLIPNGPASVYPCGQMVHVHGSDCRDEAGNITCWTQEHMHDEACRCRQLRFADSSVSVEITLTNAVCVPENLNLRAVLIQQENEQSYAAMKATLEDLLSEGAYSVKDAVFCRLELTAGGKPYPLHAGVQAQVHITFPSPVLASGDATEHTLLHTVMLNGGEPKGKLFDVDYEGRDGGLTDLYFSADRVSAFAVALSLVEEAN